MSLDDFGEPLVRAQLERGLARELDRLERTLESRSKQRMLSFRNCASLPGFTPTLVRRAEELTRRVWVAGGSGALVTEHALVETIAAAGDPGSLPFLRECLDRRIPRDKAGPQRRAFALVGIGILARDGNSEAKADLRTHLAAADASMRTAAVRAVQQVFDEGVPEDLLADLDRIARESGAFAPRFLARATLLALGGEPILDAPHGSYTFTAILRETRGVTRTVELHATQPLYQLADAVLAAYRWDDDHLSCFYFDESDRRGPLTVGGGEDEPLGTATPIGALGLTKGQRFVFHFDFGDDNLFDIRVDAIAEQAPARVKLPRVVARKGASPKQYSGDW